MTADWNLLLAALFASVPVCITPGPNNIICAAIGARYGARQALPYALGVTVGFPLLLCAVGLGLGTLLRAYPHIQHTAQVLGALFLAYLALRIARAAPVQPAQSADGTARQGFWYAVAFQWINPKALSYSFSLIALYTRPQALLLDVLLLMALSAAITLPITMGWALGGNILGKWLRTPAQQRGFNMLMGALLLMAAVSIFFYQPGEGG